MSRKCHYVYDKEVGKVLIPGCWGVGVTNDMERCTCRNENKESVRIEKLKQTIRELEKENAKLYRIIRGLHKNTIIKK